MATEVCSSLYSASYTQPIDRKNAYASIHLGLKKIKSTKTPLRIMKQILSWLEMSSFNPHHGQIITLQRKAVGLVAKTYSVPKFMRSNLKLGRQANTLFQKIHGRCSLREIVNAISVTASAVLATLSSSLSFIYCLDSTKIIDLSRYSLTLSKSLGEFSCVISLSHSTAKLVHHLAKFCKISTAIQKAKSTETSALKSKRCTNIIKITLNLIKITSLVIVALGLFFSIHLSPWIVIICSSVAFTISFGEDLRKFATIKLPLKQQLRNRISICSA